MTDTTVLSLLDDLVARARSAGADAADAVAVRGDSLSVAWRRGALEHVERSEGEDIGLRVLIGRRQAAASSADRSPAALAALVERAVAMAKVAPEDPTAGLADPAQLARDWPDLDLFDPSEPTVEELSGFTAAAEEAMLAVPGVSANSEGAEASWGRSALAVVASNGFAAQYQRTGSSLTAVALAGEGTGMERQYDSHSVVHRADLEPPDLIGRRAGERAVKALGARKPKSQAVPIVFERRVASGMLMTLAGAINGQAIARGTSFLKGAMGEPVFAKGVRVMDDPRRHRGLASRPFDGEGLPAEPLALIEDGVLQCWLLNLATARQLGLESNGRATRSIGAAPGIGATNLYMEPGEQTPEAMIREIEQGLFVTQLIGQGVNIVTGTYSRGCTGFWIEKGEIAYPVSEITIAGNLREMFQGIRPASDLEFRSSVNAPTLRIDGMTVAGA
ncbi:MAG: TldD/PmbA family protein [Alphaproteobacteria bacterium]|nr:TldD/PmbA family protein [Alphaproteobacteria bacterium]MCB9928078.1 TldD/PmbA family protein [Alphaproteobacteria bacterium]